MTSGDRLQQQFETQGNQYQGDAANFENNAIQGYADLAGQPGYSAEDTAAIKGDPNAAFKYYNPEAVTGIAGKESGALNGAVDTQDAQDNYIGGQYVNQSNDLAGEYSGNLNSDLNKDDLTVSPQEQQAIRQVAANTTQAQYAGMQDQAKLRAAAQGNTSPAAEAAIEAQLERQGAIDAGTSASNAEVAANQARLGAAQTYSGMKTSADTNVANLRSANQANAAKLLSDNANTVAGNRMNAAATGGAAETAANEYGQNTGENLASTADQAASTRATTTANQTLAGQQKVRDFNTGEQSLQQGANADAQNRQLAAYGNEYSGANNATAIGSDNESKAAANTTAMVGNIAGAASGALAAFAKGGVITKPTVGIIGEAGPEKVVKLGGPRRYRAPIAA